MAVKDQTCFMSKNDRELFPTSVPKNRFGNEMCPIRGYPHIGPGSYENDEKTSMFYQSKNMIVSSKGYTLGARTGPRLKKVYQDKTPAPSDYFSDTIEPSTQEHEPFGSGAERFPVFKKDILEVIPGPGAYDANAALNKKVQWHQSFGGAPIHLPQVTHKSTIEANTYKLYSTTEERKYFRKLAYLQLYY